MYQMKEGMASTKDLLGEKAADSEPFSYGELSADHSARVFAREVTGRHPADVFGRS